MYGFLIGVGVLLLLSEIWMVYRIQTLVSVVKGSDKKLETTSNKVNAFLFIVFLVGTKHASNRVRAMACIPRDTLSCLSQISEKKKKFWCSSDF